MVEGQGGDVLQEEVVHALEHDLEALWVVDGTCLKQSQDLEFPWTLLLGFV